MARNARRPKGIGRHVRAASGTMMNATMRVLPRPAAVAFFLTVLLGLTLWPGAGVTTAWAQAAPAPGILASVPAARQASNVAIITIEGPISAVTAKSVERRIKLAQRSGADAIVIDLNTPGGELGPALEISNAIKQCPISNTVAWVHPSAYSAGAVIALACREIVTSDPGTMGDALPIMIDRTGGLVPLPEHERQKLTAPLLAEVVDSARRRGHDEYLVQGMVALGVELWLVENPKTGERLCINRAEYEELFGAPPPTLRPRLFSAPAGYGSPDPLRSRNRPPASTPDSGAPAATPDSPPPGPSTAAPSPKTPTPNTPTPNSPADPNAAPSQSQPVPETSSPPPEPATPDTVGFKPASPRFESMSREITMGQERSSQRPAITAADRGKWRLIEYVSDGHGPITLSADDLVHLRLAASKVSSDEQLRQFFGAQNVRRLDQNWSESLVVFLTNMIVRYFLTAIFLIALVMEMLHPGLILPGSIAALALVLLIAPPMLIGMAMWWQIAAIIGGILLLAVEILVLPGFGIPGVLGMLLLFVGLIGTFVGQGGGLFPNSPEGRTELLGGLVTVLTSFITAGISIYFITKNLSSIPVLNKMVLKPLAIGDDDNASVFEAFAPPTVPVAVGDIGISLTPLRPSGKAQFQDRIIDVSSSMGYIEPRTSVRVVSADAFQITVEPAAQTA